MASYYRRVAVLRLGNAAERARRLATVFEQVARDAVSNEGSIGATPVPVIVLPSVSNASAGNGNFGARYRWWPILATAIGVCLTVAGLLHPNPPATPAVALTGTVTDSFCGQHHAASSGATCVRNCASHGAKYALYDGTRLYELGDQRLGERFAAQKVNITGALDRSTNTLRVTSIKPAS